jgi:ParB-like chromosome segregation protein Spo0J
MRTEQLDINKVIPYEKNAKKHEKKQIQQVANSIDRFGWVQPLVVDKDNNLIIGHCRLEAAKILKQTSEIII